MAGVRGNLAWLMAAKQTAKGTPATPAVLTTYKSPFSGGNINPNRETDRLSETDATRDQGNAYVTTSGVEGSPELYVRDGSIGFWLNAVMGSTATAGTTPNYTHTITPVAALPYITCWRNIGDLLWERFQDCKVSGLTISADAGAPLTATASVVGATTTRLTADPSVSPAIALDTSQVYNFNNAAVVLGAGATSLVSSFELGIENNVTAQQTDDVQPYDVTEGVREISLGFDMIFETLDEYNKFHYGSSVGTTPSPNIFETNATFTFTLGANNEIAFALPRITYEEFPVEPDPGGDPITVAVRAVGKRGGTPIVTATVKNQVASY